ncbi:hypothetical protein [Jannaschia sp. W003]|uniref:hypothetical protein n=1 Tax=Jannaschia sp. W003 TaxID=2867012 RepID=UPI0021A718D4|nr:hypothetical protein [Jannaschia sp. W003]UWQ22251.1 hypothetical protein K3554_04245 [Jannaschia sp. W003]
MAMTEETDLEGSVAMAKESDGKVSPTKVWFASASVDVNAAKPILPIGRHEEDERSMTRDELAAVVKVSREAMRKIQSGEALSDEEISRTYSLCRGSTASNQPEPFMLLFGSWVVTAETRALLEDLDPGPLRFHEIEVLNAARTAPLWEGAALSVMQVLTCRRDVVIEESERLRKRVGRLKDGEARFSVTAPDRDDVLVVLPPHEDASEVWLDDRLDGALFLSDRVAKALSAAKLTRGWNLRRCVKKTVH